MSLNQFGSQQRTGDSVTGPMNQEASWEPEAIAAVAKKVLERQVESTQQSIDGQDSKWPNLEAEYEMRDSFMLEHDIMDGLPNEGLQERDQPFDGQDYLNIQNQNKDFESNQKQLQISSKEQNDQQNLQSWDRLII